MRSRILVAFLLFLSLGMFPGYDGEADPRIKKLSQKYIDSQTGKIKGYRVQIHFGAERNKAMQVKSKFLARYQDMRAYDPFDAPYFKIRVGDFRTKLEAYKFLKEVQADFPGSFIVADDIELPAL